MVSDPSGVNRVVNNVSQTMSCLCALHNTNTPDNKVHGANMGPIWGRHDPAGPRVGSMNFVIWVCIESTHKI